MAKKKGEVSKSQLVRDLLKQNPTLKAKEVVSALAEKKIMVTEGLVYFVKGQIKGKRGRRKKAREQFAAVAATLGNGTVSATKSDALATIIHIKKLAGEVGGMKKLMALVEALG